MGAAGELDDRTPRPDPRVNAVVVLVAGAAAAAAYVLALLSDVLPSRGFAVALFAVAPVLAAFAWAVIGARADAEDDDALRWVAAGLAVGLPAMVLQLVSLPFVVGDGGLLSTSDSANAALYLVFHVALGGGAMLGLLRVSARRRRLVVGLGWVVVVALALDLLPLPPLLMADGDYTGVLIGAELVTAGLVAVCAVLWARRGGRTARPIQTAIGVALALSGYDLVLNAVAARRFDPLWWSSLSMRVATYAVLAVVATAVVVRQLARWERYTEAELGRRESQLGASLVRTQELLASVRQTAGALQQALLPSDVVAPPDVDVAARHRRPDADDDVWNDWYDTVLLPTGGVALVVGTVQGHDLGAAPVVGLVRGAVRSYALEGHPPSVVLERANAFLLSAGAGRRATVAYVEIYPDDRVTTVAVAGRPQVVLVPAGGDGGTPLRTRPGPELGVADDAQWDERTVLLPQGAAVVLSTGEAIGSGTGTGTIPPQSARGDVDDRSVDELAEAAQAAVPRTQGVAVVVARPSAVHSASVQRTLPVHRRSAGVARVWVGDLLAVWTQTGVVPDGPTTADLADVAQLLLTELVTNAVRHADLSIGVRATVTGERLRIAVSDSSHRMPRRATAGQGDTSGRGLFLVDTMSLDWGVETFERGGKAVWFELGLSADPASDDELDEDALLAAFADPDDVDDAPRRAGTA